MEKKRCQFGKYAKYSQVLRISEKNLDFHIFQHAWCICQEGYFHYENSVVIDISKAFHAIPIKKTLSKLYQNQSIFIGYSIIFTGSSILVLAYENSSQQGWFFRFVVQCVKLKSEQF